MGSMLIAGYSSPQYRVGLHLRLMLTNLEEENNPKGPRTQIVGC